MGRASPGLGDRRPLDQPCLHQAIEPLPNGRGRDAQGFGQLADTQRVAELQQVNDRRVARAGLEGLWLFDGLPHTFTVSLIGFLTSHYAKNFRPSSTGA
jgi:hypothetical protein